METQMGKFNLRDPITKEDMLVNGPGGTQTVAENLRVLMRTTRKWVCGPNGMNMIRCVVKAIISMEIGKGYGIFALPVV